jgi:hypothetical protein
VINAAGKCEEAFKGIGDVCFDLLRRHAGIKGSNHYNGNVDGRKKVDGHAHESHGADDGDDEAGDDYKKRIFDLKTGHQFSPAGFEALGPISLG